MENALRIGLSRQMALQNKMSVIANNLANINTAGFKRDAIQFEEFHMPVAQMNKLNNQDKTLSYVHDRAILKNFQAGAMHRTGNDLDVAINGEGWFAINTPAGERYTRNGEFKLSNDGTLVTNDGHPVLGEGGAINFGPTETQIVIARDGTVSSSEGQKGRLRIVGFASEQELKKDGYNLFRSDQPAAPIEQAHVVQGTIEQSNVQPVLELTQMIETVRAYTTQARMMQRTEDLKTEAIERLAQTPAT